MPFKRATRLDTLPPYLFADIDRKKRAALAAGKDVINFGVGDPDQPTPEFIINALKQAVDNPDNHRYPLDQGCAAFRQAVGGWLKQRFAVEVDIAGEILMLIGSKEGLGHVALAALNPGDVALVPSPGYPVYNSATIFAGATPVTMPLNAANRWLPDLDAIPADTARAARLMYLNYPNNPTGAVADLAFFNEAVAFAKANDILIVQDAAYSEIAYDTPPPSILQVPGAKSVAIELHSLSKTFNMTGWRIGFAAGNSDAIAALAGIKANLDSGQFTAIQMAAVQALNHANDAVVRNMIDLYRRRRDVLVEGLRELGFEVPCPTATFYVWMPVPKGYDSMSFASKVLDEAQVVIIPGVGFGKSGEGYVRFALSVPTERIGEALQRIKKLNLS